MKTYLTLIVLSFFANPAIAQLYIAAGDSISVMPGTIFTLQEHLQNNGKIYNGGEITLNGTAVQQLSGSGGSIDNLTANNDAVLLNDIIVNNSLLLNAGKIFDINSSKLISNGNINGAGFLKGSLNAELVLNGTGSSIIQTDQGNDAVSNAFKNISVTGIAASISFQNKLYLYDVFLPAAGLVTLNEEFILRSTNTATARVGPVGSSLVYGSNGKFVIERYIPGNRAWRLLTAPVTTASQVKISEAWQDNAPRVTNINDINNTNNPNPGYGTHITFGLPALNGYDQGINGNTSIRYLMNTGWNGVPTGTNDGSTLNSGYINDQPGYMLFVRGDRSTLLWQATAALTSPTVLRPKGKINTGIIDHPLTASFDNGFGSIFRVIGNPYPSPVNFHNIATNPVNAANGFTDAFYLWDPNITGSNGVGGFVGMSYNAAASIAAGKPVYDRTVLTGGSSSIDNSGDIQSGAAFVINYTGTASAIRIGEPDKSTGSNNTFFRPSGQIRSSLLAINNDNSISVNDGTLVSFAAVNKDAVDVYDLPKLSSFAENIAIQKDGRQLCIERRSILKRADTVFYHISKMKQKKYLLEFMFDEMELPQNTGAFLEDVYLQKRVPVNVSGISNYPFAVTSDAASADSNRFRLVFKTINRFVQVKGDRVNEDVGISWNMTDTFSIVQYQIERSPDNISFSPIGTVNNDLNEWLDIKPLPGDYFYRIKCVNSFGVISYSESVKVQVPLIKTGMYVFPNPVTDNQIRLGIKDKEAGWYVLRLFDNLGKLVYSSGFYHAGAAAVITVAPDSQLGNGMYQLVIISPGQKLTTLQVSVQKL